MSRASRLAWLATGLGLIGWVVVAAPAPGAALQGWWTALTFTSAAPIGALVWLLIRRLVGGDWGEAFAPGFNAAARGLPLVLLFVLPAVLAPNLMFSWASRPESVDVGVRRFYLNPLAFGARQIILLGGLCGLAWISPARRGRLSAGLGLVFYGVGVTFASIDWTLALHPGFTSSAAGMDLATFQLAAALAWVGLQSPRAPRAAAGDLAALLFATLLGLTYLAFVAYLVVWYGDRPAQSAWYVARTHGGWAALVLTALALGFVVPIALLLARHALGPRHAVAASSVCALLGLLAYALWREAPAFGPASLAPTALALLGQGGALSAVALWRADHHRLVGAVAAHG